MNRGVSFQLASVYFGKLEVYPTTSAPHERNTSLTRSPGNPDRDLAKSDPDLTIWPPTYSAKWPVSTNGTGPRGRTLAKALAAREQAEQAAGSQTQSPPAQVVIPEDSLPQPPIYPSDARKW